MENLSHLIFNLGAKTAVNMFQYEKTASVREKDLLRHLKVFVILTLTVVE